MQASAVSVGMPMSRSRTFIRAARNKPHRYHVITKCRDYRKNAAVTAENGHCISRISGSVPNKFCKGVKVACMQFGLNAPTRERACATLLRDHHRRPRARNPNADCRSPLPCGSMRSPEPFLFTPMPPDVQRRERYLNCAREFGAETLRLNDGWLAISAGSAKSVAAQN